MTKRYYVTKTFLNKGVLYNKGERGIVLPRRSSGDFMMVCPDDDREMLRKRRTHWFFDDKGKHYLDFYETNNNI